MANGTDADNFAADFERGSESGASKGDARSALPIVDGASGLPAASR
jgi:hypothetical protein